MRILDVRHEQTAVFAAEAVGKLTRVPGLAVLTAGPGVTNGVSAVTQAQFSGSPLVVVGGRAPENRWGMGSLQELDHPPLLAPVTKSARTVQRVGEIAGAVDEAFTLAGSSHRGPTFLDVPMDQFFDKADRRAPRRRPAAAARGRPGRAGPGRQAARRGVRARCWCWAPTSGPTGPRRPRCGSWSRPASRSSPTAWAAAWSPAVTRCWSPRPAAPPSAPRPGRGGRDPARLPARLRRLRRQGRRAPGPGRAPRRLPRPGLRARRPGGLRVRRPDRGHRRRAGGARGAAAPAGLVRLGRRPAGRRRRRGGA